MHVATAEQARQGMRAPSEPPTNLPPMKTCGTVRTPEMSYRAACVVVAAADEWISR